MIIAQGATPLALPGGESQVTQQHPPNVPLHAPSRRPSTKKKKLAFKAVATPFKPKELSE